MSNKEIIEALNRLDLSSYPYDEVKSLVCRFSPKILRVHIPAGDLIERMRPGVGFSERKDVTYRPADQNKLPQRATLPGKTAFYGTHCHYYEPLPSMRAIALFEASKLLKGDKNINGIEQYTLSRWRTSDELHLAIFAHESVFPEVSNMLLAQAKAELARQKSFLDEPLGFDDYVRFVTEQFARPVESGHNYEYIITATIAEKLMYATGVDGVMYPSVPSGGQYGMNVALREDVADNKLVLVDVNEMEYKQLNGERSLRFIQSSVPLTKDLHGYLSWKYKPYVKS